MRWWRRRRANPPPVVPRDDSGCRALERAKRADRQADVTGGEMHAVAARIRSEREDNHFAPLILEAFQKR
jgi:hypothetical protein